jgi:hypothetical protein
VAQNSLKKPKPQIHPSLSHTKGTRVSFLQQISHALKAALRRLHSILFHLKAWWLIRWLGLADLDVVVVNRVVVDSVAWACRSRPGFADLDLGLPSLFQHGGG